VLPGEGSGAPDPAVRKPAADIVTIIEELPSGKGWVNAALHILLSLCALAALAAWIEGRFGWLKAGCLAAQRKRSLRELCSRIESLRGDQAGAGDTLARLLAAFVAERFDLAETGILAGGAEAALRARGLSEELAAGTARLLERLDAERFGSAAGGLPAELIDEALRLAECLDREGRS
jgi:hypothetical protein